MCTLFRRWSLFKTARCDERDAEIVSRTSAGNFTRGLPIVTIRTMISLMRASSCAKSQFPQSSRCAQIAVAICRIFQIWRSRLRAAIELTRVSIRACSILFSRGRKFQQRIFHPELARTSRVARGDGAKSRSRISRDRRQLTKSRRGRRVSASEIQWPRLISPATDGPERGHKCINFTPQPRLYPLRSSDVTDGKMKKEK